MPERTKTRTTRAKQSWWIAVQRFTRLALAFVFAACLGAVAPVIAAETNEFHIARQPGLVYTQAIIIEERKLVEKHAAALGLADIKVKYSIITSARPYGVRVIRGARGFPAHNAA
jgi:NitT/TauT family transport system substrate-binding protein